MRTDADRSEKYTAKYVATTVGLKVASRLGTMKSGFAAAIPFFTAYDLQVQGILNDDGVMGVSRALYYNFVREVAGKQYRGSEGVGLKADALIIFAKWVTFGADSGILKTCALQCFGIVVP
jgi:hypothetical protein